MAKEQKKKKSTTRAKVTLAFTEELLGTSPANPELLKEYIASKAPTPEKEAEEIEVAEGDVEAKVEAEVQKQMTVFPRTDDDKPFLWDYQIKGFFKDACGMLRRCDGTRSKKVKAYKKEIDGLLFITPRKIPLNLNGNGLGTCERPLRAQTPKGECVALVLSETVPPGTSITFDVEIIGGAIIDCLEEWLDYGAKRGLGQWRNSGKGRFEYEMQETE